MTLFHSSRTPQRLCVLFALLIGMLLFSATAGAATPTQLWQVPESGAAGAAAGQLDHPYGIAADPDSGHVYIADTFNARVSEFDAWGEFVKAWGWGVRDGAAELQTCGPGATPPSSTCLRGSGGGGAGQFGTGPGSGPYGIAIDAAGDVYVDDNENLRVQKFDSAGHFLLMFGSEVNKTTSGDVCTAVSGDTCGKGTRGEGDGQFIETNGRHIAVGPAGTVFVGGRKGRIQEFEASGAFKSKVILEGELAGNNVQSLVVEPSGNFYVIAGSDDDHVYKFSPSGALLSSIAVELSIESPIALDAAGHIYVAAEKHNSSRIEIVEFSSSGTPVIALGAGFAVLDNSAPDHDLLPMGLATNTVTSGGGTDIYVTTTSADTISFASAFGPPPDKWAPPQFAPDILAQYAISVDVDRAVLGAQIDPRFWSDTSYYLEWGTGKCSEGGCPNLRPAAPGTQLVAGVVGGGVPTKGIVLAGLSPGTTYHYRFVAQSSGGGPVHGIGGGETEATFITPSPAGAPNQACPNQVFRSGASAHLPDCRAYEMVSPVEKNNSDIATLININSSPAAMNISALAGGKLTYTTAQGFGDAQGVPYVSQYIAARSADGWQNHAITAPQGLSGREVTARSDVDFRAFSADLCDSVLVHNTDPPLTSSAVEGFTNLYRRHNCAPGADAYEALTTVKPPTNPVISYSPEIQGLSADGRCTVFQAEDQLTPDATAGILGEGSKAQLYESCGGQLRLISLLPNGKASAVGASAGTANGGSGRFRSATTGSAVSTDGSRVYWTESAGSTGKLYVRVNAEQEQSAVVGGQCTEEEKACTIRVSQSVSPGAAHFWAASADGSRALFTIENNGSEKLYEFDLESGQSTLIAATVNGVVGAGGGTSRAYFVSPEALSGANAEGHSPSVGEPNLYFFENAEAGHTFSFIATLSTADAKTVTGTAREDTLSPLNLETYKKTSRVNASGRAVAFMSNARLGGYDNVGLQSGKATAEVYVYDAAAAKLSCVSCNPTGQRPVGRQVKVEGFASNWMAALLPTYASGLYGSRVLSEDGKRLFFNSYEALLARDTNGKADVYEWEASGSGDCTQQSAAYSVPNGGCLSLISSGESPSDSEFVDASADGTDVFFTTGSSLLPQDVGLIDIYDARIGGGYPPPSAPLPACEGEACQGPLAPPNDPTPGSSSYTGPGNPVPAKERKKKAKRKSKKQHKKVTKKHKRATGKGRAGR